MNETFYDILGVGRDASQAEIQAAYRQKARKYHPDAGEGSDAEKFRAVNEVYEVLSDPDKRRFYDANDFYDPTFDEGIAEAAAILFLASVKRHRGDPVKITIDNLFGEVASYRVRKAGLEQEVKKMSAALLRLSSRDKRKQEKLVGVILRSISELEADIMAMKRKIVVGDAIREYLTDIVWKPDEAASTPTASVTLSWPSAWVVD